jgi:hypothetical protein
MHNWNTIFSSRRKWQRFFYKFVAIVEPRFLYELIIPQDIVGLADKVKLTEGHDKKVFRFIIAASVFNGILVGLPGTLGWGVIAAYAVEVLMALQIARMVGLIEPNEKFPLSKILKLIPATGITALTVAYGFKAVLNIVFSVMANIAPVGWAAGSAAIFTTLFYGFFIYLAFIEINNFSRGDKLSFRSIKRILGHALTYTREIFKSLAKLIFKDSPRLFIEVRENVSDAWNGVVNVQGRIKGEIFLAGCLAYLLQGNFRGLEGPFSQLWLQSWLLAFPNKLASDAGPVEIKALAESYDGDAFDRVRQNVTSKFYEVLETTHENIDGDVWSAKLIEAQNNPVSDAIFFSSETGNAYEINYKFTENKHYIESHIQEHPDVPVIAPPEIAEKINDPLVIGGHFEHETVLDISEQNFEALLEKSHDLYLEAGAAAAGIINLGIYILPFLIAYKRGKITRDQLAEALKKFSPNIAARTINRIAMLTLLGPVYGMFLVAGFGFKLALYGFDDIETDEAVPEPPTHPTQEPKVKKKFSRRSMITLSFLEEF